MGLRPSKCYRKLQRAYTRKSKFKKQSYVKSIPQNKIVKYNFGDLKTSFPYHVNLICKEPIQIRHNALESARIVTLRKAAKIGKTYSFHILVYPHHILRENKMLTGAGADRMQKGMQLAFGRPEGLAAQVRKNQVVFSIRTEQQFVEIAKEALKAGSYRLPGKYTIEVSQKI